MIVSVIIPNFNHSNFLKQRIDSILNQTFKDFELIILDDCSTDNSRAIINQYKTDNPEIVTCFNEEPSGSSFAQWNSGVKMANGEFIWIAESDDIASVDFLEKTVQVLKENPDAGLVFSDSRIINEQNGIEYLASDRNNAFTNSKLAKYFNREGGKTSSPHLFWENPIVNVSSVLFRKASYLKTGGADPSMKFCGDWMLYLKMFLISDIRYIPETLNIFRLHSGSGYHTYYRSNILLREKIKIFYYIIKNTEFSLQLICMAILKTTKAILLRLYFWLKFDTLFHLDIPRQPRSAKILQQTDTSTT